MKRLVLAILLIFPLLSIGQSLENQLIGKTYARTFYAVGFKHTASYTFYKDRIRYHVKGFFIDYSYDIVGKYYKDRFVGTDHKGNKYIVHIQVVSPTKIKVNKEGVPSQYQNILSNKPVGDWKVYELVR